MLEKITDADRSLFTIEIALREGAPFLLPVKIIRNFAPKLVGFVDAMGIQLFVSFQ